MASHLVGQHQQTSFATPVNGAAGDATVVLGNDNATVTTYNAHDIDPTIHVQDSNAAVFAVTPAGTAGRKWMTNDTGGVYLYFDTGATWVEVNYQRTSSTGAVVIVSTSTPQLTVEYDGTHTSTFSVSSAGALTINATSTVTITPATTFSGGATIASGQVLALAGSTVTGSPAWGSTQTLNTGGNAGTATALETARTLWGVSFNGTANVTAQPTFANGATLSAALTYGGVTLSNAVTGTGNMALSASPTFTGTVTVASLTATGTVTVTGATITGLTAASVATGTFPGVYTITGALTLSAALTYGGVTLSNAVTGTGNMVLSAGPTFTGTAAFATVTTSSTINGQTISATASFTGTVTIATGLTVSAGTTAVQALTATGVSAGSDVAIFRAKDTNTLTAVARFGRSDDAVQLGIVFEPSTPDMAIWTTTAHNLKIGTAGVAAITITATTQAVAFSSDISVATTKKVGLNAGLTSYLYESGAGVVDLVSSAVVRVFDAATLVALFDTGGVGSNTVGLSVYDKDNGGLKRVGVGASDSGGSGFRLLRVAN